MLSSTTPYRIQPLIFFLLLLLPAHLSAQGPQTTIRISQLEYAQRQTTSWSTGAAPRQQGQLQAVNSTKRAILQQPLNTVRANTGGEILSLYKDLFQYAYATAPDIQIARDLKKQKSAQRYTAQAERLAPAIKANLSQIHEFNQATSSGGVNNTNLSSTKTHFDGEDYQDWSFTLDFPIYRRPTSLHLTIAQTKEELAAIKLLIATQNLDLRLRKLLGNYLATSYRLLNLRNSVQLLRDHANKIQRGYELRDQTRLQLLRAQANLKELEARRDLDEQRKEAVFRDLLDYTGLQWDHPVFARLNNLLSDEATAASCIRSLSDLQDSYAHIQSFVESSTNTALQQYFNSHSLLVRRIQLERNLADKEALTYTENEWPELSLRGLYNRQNDTPFNHFEGDGTLAFVFSVPLFTGGTIFSNSKSKTMAQHIADVTQFADLREARHSLENNRQLISSLNKVYATQKIHLAQQREIVVLSLKSYDIKQTSMQDLLTSQNRLIDAKNALMETTSRLGTLYRLFAWQLGIPYPVPAPEKSSQ